MELLEAIEQSGLGTWVRSSNSVIGFPGILVLHALGMAFLAGSSAALDLRILGVASDVPLGQLDKFFPVMWLGLVVNTISGVLLLAAYPVKAFTNPLFYFKLACIAIAVALTVLIRNNVVRKAVHDTGPASAWAGTWAAASLVAWVGAIVSGRFLAYTCEYLLAGVPC